ncbi:MAG: DsrE family protein [Chloroflexi bacterium]|nr:DsrE family protein [Chloroflexota bacterium]
MELLLVINRAPYDGTDVAWNALRLARTALDAGLTVRLFLMNDGVDLAREGSRPAEAEFDLQEMLRDLIDSGAVVRLCKTCLTRCGIGAGEVEPRAQVAGMKDLLDWIQDSDKVLTF